MPSTGHCMYVHTPEHTGIQTWAYMNTSMLAYQFEKMAQPSQILADLAEDPNLDPRT